MSFYKIIGFAVLGVICTTLFRRMKEEYALFISLCLCVGLTICGLGILKPVIDYLKELGDQTDAGSLFSLLFKSCGVALISAIAGDLCRDASESALGTKIEFCGKCTILALSFPLIKAVFEETLKILG